MLVIYSTAKGQALQLEAGWAKCDRVISHAVRDNARDSAPDISMGQFTAWRRQSGAGLWHCVHFRADDSFFH